MNKKQFRLIATILTVVLFFGFPAVGAVAFQLTPMSAVIDPTAPSPTVSFEVNNDGNAPVAVELRATTRRIDRDGTEFNDDASDRIQLFPTQLILRPGTSQTVRARWIGESMPDRELPFRVVAEQLPVNLNRDQEGSSGVQFMLRYRATLYVRPAGTSARIEVVNLDTGRDADLEVEVRNDGTRHQLFTRGTLVVEDSNGQSHNLSLADLEAFVGVNVLPGATRRIRIPREQLPPDPVALRFQFN